MYRFKFTVFCYQFRFKLIRNIPILLNIYRAVVLEYAQCCIKLKKRKIIVHYVHTGVSYYNNGVVYAIGC